VNYGVEFYPLGFVFILIFLGIIGYAIAMHNLFNIKVIVANFVTSIILIFLGLRVLFSTSTQERVVDGAFFIIICVFGFVLVKSVKKEIKQKEQIEILAGDLSKANMELVDLNENLEAKVAEQTKEIRRAYEVEKKARHELEELDKAKTDFILTTQHHLRTPLTVVKGVANMLTKKHHGDTLSETDEAFIQKLSEGSDKLAKLINDFLDISQMEVGKSLLNKEPTNPQDLINESIQELSHEIETKQLRIESSFSDEVQTVSINVDKKRMLSAIMNLLDNAVKYTPKEGRITVIGEITTHPIEKKQQYTLTIEDSGIGMTEEEQTKAFTRSFERGEKAKQLNATGRGIGLMLTKQIIESHGGTIELHSEGRDKGSSFTVHLPLEK
jgi:signal transduction histidine kinase